MGNLKVYIVLFWILFFKIESFETGEGYRTCPNDSLPCDDGECVSRGKWCDGEKNCNDESDEAYCNERGWWNGYDPDPNLCEGTHFLCNIGQCIPLLGQCDGFEDCIDRSDEWNCEPETVDYGDHMLSTTTTMVPTDATSIESSSETDGLENDDITTTTQSSLFFTQAHRTCPNDSLPCDDGECVSRGKWCDGEKNCHDESDEAYCKRRAWWDGGNPNLCEGAHFLCNIGQCIPLVGQCDGFEDCKDRSDEWNCEPETVDYGDYLLSTTTTMVPTDTTSIESSPEIDGLENDDITTTTQSSLSFTQEGYRTCPKDSLPCDDGECVSRGRWCDGEKNCPDESDEAYCKRRGWWNGNDLDPNLCEGTHFLCNIGQCIPLVGQCDGFEDCMDRSDEWNCEPETVDYGDYMLSTTTTMVPTETTSIESSSEIYGLENDDITTTTQSFNIFSRQGAAEYRSSHIQSPTSNYSPTRYYVVGYLPTIDNIPDRRINYPHSTPSRSHFEGDRSPPFQFQTRPTRTHDPRTELHHSLNQPTITSSYRAVNQNQPANSFPKTRTDAYHQQTQLMRPKEPSRTISENQQQNRPTIYSTLQQPFDARQQYYGSRQQPSESSRHQAYDPKRNPDLFQSQSPRPNSYISQPSGQASHYLTSTESTDHNSSPGQREGPLRSRKWKTEKSEAEKRIESALNFLQMFTEKPEKDERSVFCELLCIQLREMDTYMRLVAMHEINSVIFRLKRASHSAVDGGDA